MASPLVVITDSPVDDYDVESEILNQVGARIKRAVWDTEQDLITEACSADALLFMHAPLNHKVLSSLQQCKVAVRYGVGLDNVDLKAAERLGIPIYPVLNYCTEEVANHTLALILAWNRKIIEGHKLVCSGGWNKRSVATGNWALEPMSGLSCLTLGIVGLGQIGRAVAERARAFGMKIITYDPFVSNEEASKLRIPLVTLEKLLGQADIVTLHLPLNENTCHLFDSTSFNLMKPGSILVNTSRGGLVDEVALANALITGKIGGALLDVFELEPLPETSFLRKFDNVIFTPHVAFYSEDSLYQLRSMAAEKVLNVLKGPS